MSEEKKNRQQLACDYIHEKLGKLGYSAVSRRFNGMKTRGWIVYQRDTSEIDCLKRLLKE